MLTHRLSPYREERRLVTVLFADLSDFTALAEALDPEEIGDLLNRVWTALDALVQEYGGRVDKHLGDSIMAVWGAPRATEEDAERAVMCALALHRKLDELNTSFAQFNYPQLQLHIGLNSGSVVTAFINSTGEYSVIGDMVNVAQRLQGTAPPGRVVIGPGTYRLVRDVFRLKALPPQELRGRTLPVESYEVLGPETHPVRVRYRAADSVDVRLYGRDAEMARLQIAYDQAWSTRQPQLVLVTGEAGMGKSRLLFEFTHRLELAGAPGLLLSARALAEGANAPYVVWETIWANRFGMMKDEPAAGRREKFARGLREVWGSQAGTGSAPEAVHVLGYLIGLDWPESTFLPRLRTDPQRLRRCATDLAVELFRRAGEQGPILLLLDDLQHADAASLDLVDALLDQADLPLAVMGASRLPPDQIRAAWSERASLHHMTLGPLKLTANTVTAIFPRAASLPEAFRRRLALGADGSPYFLEEMVKSLLQTGILVSRDEGWEFAKGHPPESIPLSASLQAQLQARLDALTPQARAVALAASVVGRTFWSGILETLLRHTTITSLLTPPPDDNWASPLSRALEELQRQELVFERRGSIFIGEREFIFKHSLLRETAYNLLPRKIRQPFHALVADWLARRPVPDYLLAVAEHYTRSGHKSKAAQYYALAASQLEQRGHTREAALVAQAASAVRS